MADEIEAVENLSGDGLSALRVGAFLGFQASDGPVVEPPGGDRGHQCRCIPDCRADRALQWFDEFLWCDDESEAKAGGDALGQPGYVDRRLRRERGQRSGWTFRQVRV